MRDWLPGGMPYAELYKGMQVDDRVYDYGVRIIRVLDGPDAGDAYVLCQDLYRIAKGSAMTKQAIEKALHCSEAGVEGLVGPNIMQMLKYSAYQTVSVPLKFDVDQI